MQKAQGVNRGSKHIDNGQILQMGTSNKYDFTREMSFKIKSVLSVLGKLLLVEEREDRVLLDTQWYQTITASRNIHTVFLHIDWLRIYWLDQLFWLHFIEEETEKLSDPSKNI